MPEQNESNLNEQDWGTWQNPQTRKIENPNIVSDVLHRPLDRRTALKLIGSGFATIGVALFQEYFAPNTVIAQEGETSDTTANLATQPASQEFSDGNNVENLTYLEGEQTRYNVETVYDLRFASDSRTERNKRIFERGYYRANDGRIEIFGCVEAVYRDENNMYYFDIISNNEQNLLCQKTTIALGSDQWTTSTVFVEEPNENGEVEYKMNDLHRHSENSEIIEYLRLNIGVPILYRSLNVSDLDTYNQDEYKNHEQVGDYYTFIVENNNRDFISREGRSGLANQSSEEYLFYPEEEVTFSEGSLYLIGLSEYQNSLVSAE